MSGWWLAVPGGLVVAGWAVTARWIARLQATVQGLTERVARLEGRVNGDHR